jgi:excisionase family DNA binding protein
MKMVTVLEDNKWMTPTQAARMLGVSPIRVRQLMKDGKLEYTVTPLGRLVDTESVEARRASRVAVAA